VLQVATNLKKLDMLLNIIADTIVIQKMAAITHITGGFNMIIDRLKELNDELELDKLKIEDCIELNKKGYIILFNNGKTIRIDKGI